jgi:hypothetical protein
VEMQPDFAGRNEIDARFLDVIRLHTGIAADDREPQLPWPCPEAMSRPKSITWFQKSLTHGSETGWLGMLPRINIGIARENRIGPMALDM